MSNYEPVMGLEIHVQIKTKTKMFCPCAADYEGDAPNTYCCPVCLGLPGALPAPNVVAVEKGILFGLSTGCAINSPTIFSRKNYFYPDLPKGYQISQFERPLCVGGSVEIKTENDSNTIAITEAHLEEDTGKSLHTDEGTLLDFNKSGIPLLEIVSAPQLHTKEEVLAYAQTMQQLIRYLDISNADMEKGQMRFEINISLREKGKTELPDYRVEVKNLNSFRVLGLSVDYEIGRQTELLKQGGRLVQETRGWDEKGLKTKVQRVKEGASDYRYFPEPDIPPLTISDDLLATIRKRIPELPREKKRRFMDSFGLPEYDADVLMGNLGLVSVFEKAAAELEKKEKEDYRALSRWIIGPYLNIHSAGGGSYEASRLTPKSVSRIVDMVKNNEITPQTALDIGKAVFETGKSPEDVIREKGLGKVTAAEELAMVAVSVIRENPKAVEDFKQGKENAVSFLIGQVMKKTQGRADHATTRKIIEEQLRRV